MTLARTRNTVVLVIVSVLLVTAPLASHLAPWFETCPVPVVLRLDAPVSASISLYGDEQELLALAACLKRVVGIVLLKTDRIARLRMAAACAAIYALPVAILGTALGVWSMRNFQQHQMFAPTSMVGVSRVEGQMQGGTFDIRALADDFLTQQYLHKKYREHFAYCGWNVRETVNDALTQNGRYVRLDHIPVLEQKLKDIAARSDSLAPWELKLGGLVRAVAWAFRLPPHYSFTRNAICPHIEYCGNNPDTITWWHNCRKKSPPGCFDSSAWASLDTMTAGNSWALELTQSKLWNAWHRRLYKCCVAFGLLGAFAALWRRSPEMAAPALVFLANVGLISWLLNVQGRYIQVFEFAVVFQAAAGLYWLICLISRSRAWRAPMRAGGVWQQSAGEAPIPAFRRKSLEGGLS